MNTTADQVPDGFQAFDHAEHFANFMGPYFFREMPAGDFRYAFWTGSQHANPNGVTHGGALFSFADHITGHAIVQTQNRMCATLKFKVNYVAAAALNSLVEGQVEIVHTTRTLAFVRVQLSLGDQILMSADGTCKLFARFESRPASTPASTSAIPDDTLPVAPVGYLPFPDQGGFPRLCGPVHYRRLEDGSFINGFQSRLVHDNTNGVVHGGVLFTFADDIIGRAVSGISRRYATTVSMNVEYISAGPLNTWIEGITEVTHMDDGFAFIRSRIFTNNQLILTADGVCRLLGPYSKVKPETAA